MSDGPTTYGELATILERLPDLIRDSRRARGLSLRAAAKEIGVQNSTLLRIEGGEGFNSKQAVPLLRWLDLTGRVVAVPGASVYNITEIHHA